MQEGISLVLDGTRLRTISLSNEAVKAPTCNGESAAASMASMHMSKSSFALDPLSTFARPHRGRRLTRRRHQLNASDGSTTSKMDPRAQPSGDIRGIGLEEEHEPNGEVNSIDGMCVGDKVFGV